MNRQKGITTYNSTDRCKLIEGQAIKLVWRRTDGQINKHPDDKIDG